MSIGSAQAQFNITGSVTGRVVSITGKGIRRASVTLTNLQTLETQMCVTNDFGYFRFENAPLIDLHLLSVKSKRYAFTHSSQLIQFTTVEYNTLFTSDN